MKWVVRIILTVWLAIGKIEGEPVSDVLKKNGSQYLFRFSSGEGKRNVRCTPCGDGRDVNNYVDPEYRGNGADNLGYDWSPRAWGGPAFARRGKNHGDNFQMWDRGRSGRLMPGDWGPPGGAPQRPDYTCDRCRMIWGSRGIPNGFNNRMGEWNDVRGRNPSDVATVVSQPISLRPEGRIAYVPSPGGEMYWDGVSGGGTRWDGFSNGISWVGNTGRPWNDNRAPYGPNNGPNGPGYQRPWTGDSKGSWYNPNRGPNFDSDRGYASNWHYGSTNQFGWNGNNMKWNYGNKNNWPSREGVGYQPGGKFEEDSNPLPYGDGSIHYGQGGSLYYDQGNYIFHYGQGGRPGYNPDRNSQQQGRPDYGNRPGGQKPWDYNSNDRFDGGGGGYPGNLIRPGDGGYSKPSGKYPQGVYEDKKPWSHRPGGFGQTRPDQGGYGPGGNSFGSTWQGGYGRPGRLPVYGGGDFSYPSPGSGGYAGGYPGQSGGGGYPSVGSGGYGSGGYPQRGSGSPGGYPRPGGSYPAYGGSGSSVGYPGSGVSYPTQGGSFPVNGGSGYPSLGSTYPSPGGGGSYPNKGSGGSGYAPQNSGPGSGYPSPGNGGSGYPTHGSSAGSGYPSPDSEGNPYSQPGGGYPSPGSGGSRYPSSGGGNVYPSPGGPTGSGGSGYSSRPGSGGSGYPSHPGPGGSGYPTHTGSGGSGYPTHSGSGSGGYPANPRPGGSGYPTYSGSGGGGFPGQSGGSGYLSVGYHSQGGSGRYPTGTVHAGPGGNVYPRPDHHLGGYPVRPGDVGNGNYLGPDNRPKGYYTGYITELDGGGYPTGGGFSSNGDGSSTRYPIRGGGDRFGDGGGGGRFPGQHHDQGFPSGGSFDKGPNVNEEGNSWNYGQDGHKDGIYRRAGGSYPPYRGGEYFTSSYLASASTPAGSSQAPSEGKAGGVTKADQATEATSESS